MSEILRLVGLFLLGFLVGQVVAAVVGWRRGKRRPRPAPPAPPSVKADAELVLSHLYRHWLTHGPGEAIGLLDLVALLGMQPPRVSRALTWLAEAGFVQRVTGTPPGCDPEQQGFYRVTREAAKQFLAYRHGQVKDFPERI